MANTVRAKSWYRKAWPSYCSGGGAPALKHPIVASAQTIYKGDFVQLDATGKAVLAVVGVAYLYGLALEDGVVGSQLAVAAGDEDTVFIIQGKDGVASSTGIAGATGDLYISGSGVSRKPQIQTLLPLDNIFLIVGQVPDDDPADTTNPGRLFVRILKSQYTGA